jgi:hypothetical protein
MFIQLNSSSDPELIPNYLEAESDSAKPRFTHEWARLKVKAERKLALSSDLLTPKTKKRAVSPLTLVAAHITQRVRKHSRSLAIYFSSLDSHDISRSLSTALLSQKHDLTATCALLA